MEIEITYNNPSGFECKAVLREPLAIDHVWYSSKRNRLGKFERHEVTIFGSFLSKLRGCTNIKVVQR